MKKIDLCVLGVCAFSVPAFLVANRAAGGALLIHSFQKSGVEVWTVQYLPVIALALVVLMIGARWTHGVVLRRWFFGTVVWNAMISLSFILAMYMLWGEKF